MLHSTVWNRLPQEFCCVPASKKALKWSLAPTAGMCTAGSRELYAHLFHPASHLCPFGRYRSSPSALLLTVFWASRLSMRCRAWVDSETSVSPYSFVSAERNHLNPEPSFFTSATSRNT